MKITQAELHKLISEKLAAIDAKKEKQLLETPSIYNRVRELESKVARLEDLVSGLCARVGSIRLE